MSTKNNIRNTEIEHDEMLGKMLDELIRLSALKNKNHKNQEDK